MVFQDETTKSSEREGKFVSDVQLPLKFSDDMDESFICHICLDLVHKPVVNACGHMFCFLCMHNGMKIMDESFCPLCRRTFMHFPRISEQLHFFLLKALPDAYRRRCLEENKKLSAEFTPQFNDGLDLYKDNDAMMSSPNDSTVRVMTKFLEGGKDEETNSTLCEEFVNGKDPKAGPSCRSKAESDLNSIDAVGSINSDMDVGASGVTAADLLCGSCCKLLCRPVVLNCGHLFCEGCVARIVDVENATLKCSTCGSVHPGAFLSIFLQLRDYLEQKFPVDYDQRERELRLQAAELQKTTNTPNEDAKTSDRLKEEGKLPARQQFWSVVGCDGCGMYPMIGNRYKCEDCKAFPGYDLCQHCYKNETNLAGRYNQQHTREHRMIELRQYYQVENLDEGRGSMEVMDNFLTVTNRTSHLL